MGFTIRQFAAQVGVNVTTVRFYECKGLLPKPARAPSGYRNYSDDDMPRMRFIRRAQNLGFTLTEIRELLDLRDDPGCCDQVHGLIARRLQEVERQLSSLRAMKGALIEHERWCTSGASHDCCPLLNALEAEDDPVSRKPARPQKTTRGGTQ